MYCSLHNVWGQTQWFRHIADNRSTSYTQPFVFPSLLRDNVRNLTRHGQEWSIQCQSINFPKTNNGIQNETWQCSQRSERRKRTIHAWRSQSDSPIRLKFQWTRIILLPTRSSLWCSLLEQDQIQVLTSSSACIFLNRCRTQIMQSSILC